MASNISGLLAISTSPRVRELSKNLQIGDTFLTYGWAGTSRMSVIRREWMISFEWESNSACRRVGHSH
jgi:hypothetical protein